MSGLWRLAGLAAFAALLGACAQLAPPAAAPETKAPADFPGESYLQAAGRGEIVYRLDPTSSEAVIHSYRSGRLGHNHVIASHEVNGFARLANDVSVGQADIYVPLASLSVDEAPLRARAGFDTQPSESDIAGTRTNMLTKVLDAQQFPYATIRVERIEREGEGVALVGLITLHGVARPARIPAQMTYDDRELRVVGKFSLRQTDFGMTPYSVLGGLFQVKDEIDLSFNILARRLQ